MQKQYLCYPYILGRCSRGKIGDIFYPKREIEGNSFLPLQGIATVFLESAGPHEMGVGIAKTEDRGERGPYGLSHPSAFVGAPEIFLCWGLDVEPYAIASLTHWC